MNKNFFLVIIIFVIIITSIIGIVYFVNYFTHKGSINEKAEEELGYISQEIVDMANSLNNITFTNTALQTQNDNKEDKEKSNEENEKEEQKSGEEETKIKYNVIEKGILNSDLEQIDWEYLKDKTEKLYSIWTVSIIDLRTLNVESSDILEFSNILDLVNLSSKNEDKNSLLNNLVSLYSYIPKFLEQISKDNNKKINIEKTKLSILNSYNFVNLNNWNEAKLNIQNAINTYSSIVNNIENNSNNNDTKILKVFIQLNELNNTSELQDRDLYYIKYKSVMEELMRLK